MQSSGAPSQDQSRKCCTEQIAVSGLFLISTLSYRETEADKAIYLADTRVKSLRELEWKHSALAKKFEINICKQNLRELKLEHSAPA